MKTFLFGLVTISILYSCAENKSGDSGNTTVLVDSPKNAPQVNTQIKPVYSVPIKHADWEIGKSEFVQTVLDFYQAWDNKEEDKVVSLFADTLRLRIPEVRNEIDIPNNKINEVLRKNRGLYNSTSNHILAAVSLHDRENNEDWVLINTYNKWTEKNGKRDSVLYHDEWRMKEGKIYFLMSYFKVPTENFLKHNDIKK